MNLSTLSYRLLGSSKTPPGAVYKEQIDLLYGALPFSLGVTLTVILLMWGFLNEHVEQSILLIWCFLSFLVVIIRAISAFDFSINRKRGDCDYRNAGRYFVASVVLSGFQWGGVGLWLFPLADLQGKMLIIVVLLGLSAGAISTLAYRLVPIFLFLLLTLVPLLIGLYRSDDHNLLPISIAIILYQMFLMKNAMVFQKNTEEMLRLRVDALEREDELISEREKAQQANSAKTEFLSRMSHELRTPLNAVLGFSQLLEMNRKEPLTGQQKNQVHEIWTAGRHLLALVDDVLDLSRIDAGKIDLKIEKVDFIAIAIESTELVDELAKRRGIPVNFEKPGEHYWLDGDYTRVKQIIVNLLSNAVKYNRPGGSVSISFREGEEGCLRLSVTDTGPGIQPERLDELFIPFNRLDAPERGVDGTGIGLSIAKHLVELMGGRIGVESRVGEGSTFWVELPGSRKNIPEDISVAPVFEQEPVSRRVGQRNRILLAEDNPANQEVTSEMLKYLGFDVTVAANGEEVLKQLAKRSYDLVLMDCQMPLLDGYEATRKLRRMEQQSELPVIALTANADEGSREKCLAAGMDDYIAKPFKLDQIQLVLDKWLQK